MIFENLFSQHLKPAIYVAGGLALTLAGSALNAEEEFEARAIVDFRKTTGDVNRAIFSTQGFMQVYVEENPMVMETFELTNPKDTQTRLETWIHRMEPENDNNDPSSFNWEGFDDQRMIRFIENRDEFEKVYHDDLGMEPLVLLGYNVEWNKSDDPESPVESHEEWAEFAAAVVESYNGSDDNYSPTMRLLQIWNEPNFHFYTGTRENWFDLYNTTARRIRNEYPGVLIGGPTITHSGEDPQFWMETFVEECGPYSDYLIFQHYGPQGQGHEVLINHVRKYAEMFRSLPGKEDGKVMITETDGWFQGWEKMKFVMARQFGFLEISDLLLGVHHFCCMEFNESGNYAFGLVDAWGGIIPGTFWPYWLFRNHIGKNVHTQKTGNRQGDFKLTASLDKSPESALMNAVLFNSSDDDLDISTYLYFSPASADRLLQVEVVRSDYQGIEEVIKVPRDSTSHELDIRLGSGESASVVLKNDGKRHFAFRDLNYQENPFLEISSETEEVNYGDRVTVEARMINTTLSDLSGRLELQGIPEQWKAEIVEGEAEFSSLGTGQSITASWEFELTTFHLEGKIAPYVVYIPDGESSEGRNLDDLAHSIPCSIPNVVPVNIMPVPGTVFATAGKSSILEVQITNSMNRQIGSTLDIELPDGFILLESESTVTIPAESRLRFPFVIGVDSATDKGVYSVPLSVDLFDTTMTAIATIEVVDSKNLGESVPIDISDYANFDPVSYFLNREDSDEMGLFRFPADPLPTNRIAFSHGIPYQMLDYSDGRKTAVLPKSQEIELQEGRYQGLSFLGFGHDGKHPGTFTLVYKDGSTDEINSQIPEWCTPPPEGFHVAFKAPHRYVPWGLSGPPCELFSTTLDVDKDKVLTKIILPEIDEDAYIFALTLHQ